MTTAAHPERAVQLLGALAAYRPARQTFLVSLGLPASNRDPFAEFSEHFVHALMGGTLAASRVQAGHDLVLDDGTQVQFRYLANPAGTLVNEQFVRRIRGVELCGKVHALFRSLTGERECSMRVDAGIGKER